MENETNYTFWSETINMAKCGLIEGWFVWDEFYSDLDDMVDEYLYDLDTGMSFDDCLDILPNKAYIASREYVKMLSVNKLIIKIARCKGKYSSYYNSDYYAQEIWEDAVDTFWNGCDIEFDELPNGISELQKAIDIFSAKNERIYRLFGKCNWFNPVLFSCGKNALKKALDGFENENRHFWVYTQSADFIELNAKFWKFWLDQFSK